MTIAAGFLLQEHIVLCADTMVTSGIKTHQSKLQGFHAGQGTEKCAFGFALAGNEVNASMAFQDCAAAVTEYPKENLTLRNTTGILRDVIADVNRKYVDGRGDAEKFDLIIGAWLPRGGGLKLFSTGGGSGLVGREYEFIGCGYYLGHVTVGPIFNTLMRLDQAVLLAIQAIALAKKYDPYCGGDTQFMMIAAGGELSGTVPYKANQAEEHIADFEQRSRRLLLALGSTELNDRDIEARLGDFAENCRRIRAFLRNKSADYLDGFLERLMQGAQPRPESTIGDPSPRPPSQE